MELQFKITNMKKISLLLVFASTFLLAQKSVLENKISSLIQNKNATVGVAILKFEEPYSISINGDKKLPMLSVFKYHLGLTILDLVDQGKMNLSKKILIKKSDLIKGTWSPIREKYPNGNITLTLSELLKYSIADSDNIGTDLLIEMIGGTETIQKFIDKKGIKDFVVKADEKQMHKGYEFMYWNTTTAISANDVLKKLYDGKILSKKSTATMMKILLETSTGATKIVAQLPKGTPVAHKTGSSGKDEKGMTVAENDIGIITLPNGKHYALSVFVSDSMESEETNTKIVADISKAVWDEFSR